MSLRRNHPRKPTESVVEDAKRPTGPGGWLPRLLASRLTRNQREEMAGKMAKEIAKMKGKERSVGMGRKGREMIQ